MTEIILSLASSSSTTGLSDVLSFNADRHEYTVNGALVPSVTQILKAEGFTPPYRNGEAAYRGTWVHQATVLIDAWQDTGPVPEAYQGYIDAYLNFIADAMPQWVANEDMFYNETWGFAGTRDRRTDGQVWDIKTGAPTVADQLQLAGYTMDDHTQERWNLYLRPDGTYDTVQHKEKEDYVVFGNAVYNYAWKRRKKK
jgi:hypothetical protein